MGRIAVIKINEDVRQTVDMTRNKVKCLSCRERVEEEQRDSDRMAIVWTKLDNVFDISGRAFSNPKCLTALFDYYLGADLNSRVVFHI